MDTEAAGGGDGPDGHPDEGASTGDALDRLNLYRYATADDPQIREQYIAIMRLFTETLLTDLSAAEVAEALAARSLPVPQADVEERCRSLEGWGNLVRSVRDARVATVAEFLHSRSRYQVSKLGGRVHRQVDELLRATTGVRDVAREMLGGMVGNLDRTLTMLTGPEPLDADALAAEVTAVFAAQRLFNESATDFYAYLNGVLARYDLVGEEYAGFKDLLLGYVDLITADVARHAPAVTTRLTALDPHLDTLLAALDALPTMTNADGTAGERLPGRTRADWDEFAAWYDGRAGRSGPQQLRTAAEQALGQLLTNAKRMLSASGTGVSRRNDLLKLAGWFAQADTDTAHRLYAAAYGAYPARHLVLGPEEVGPRAGATTSWWEAEPVEVPVSLRERGDRAARGRTSRVPDTAGDREELLAQARAEAEHAAAAAAELIAAGTLHGRRVHPAARDLVLDRLGDLFAAGQDADEPLEWTDTDLGFTLLATPSPGQPTRISAEDGDLIVDDLTLTITPLEDQQQRTGTETPR
ncbi:TIGR02677 family protein [Goekera deserti]|uniref:TIGR02677 family protein n=1 Tax=Goekera deserti TaxID=2497753 RepID=UPI00192EAC21|nr:TIGR02677 family protein [Goekera deserti]